MISKTALAVGIGAVVVLGAAGTALAAQSAPSQATPTPSSSPTAAPTTPTPTPGPSAGRSGPGQRRVYINFPGEFAQWTTFDTKTNTSTVHDGIRGQVTAVSPTSITVKAAGGTSQTFAINTDTAVRARGDSNGNRGTISQVKVGDQTVVVGTGQDSFTATLVADRGTSQQHGRMHR